MHVQLTHVILHMGCYTESMVILSAWPDRPDSYVLVLVCTFFVSGFIVIHYIAHIYG